MNYEELSAEQKRAYGFVKLTKQQINTITQLERMRFVENNNRLMENRRRPQLRVIAGQR